ncbi:MAG: hypothetical protein HKP41_20385 [Desulfobacterales bacterium]|nr:hypothetical protein [Desulfobacterales bacterium]
MKYFFILFCILLFYGQSASAGPVLSKMSKYEDNDSIRIFMAFNELPRFEKKVHSKRIDIVLKDTKIGQDAVFFTEDDKIVKILTEQHRDSAIVSLFFRYIPQKVDVSVNAEDSLVIDLLLGNRFTRSYQDLSTRLQGVTLLKRETDDFSNPLITSKYAHDWKTFFSDYETGVSITAPVKIYIPSFPIIRLLPPGKEENIELITEEGLLLAKKEKWEDLVGLLKNLLASTTDIEEKKLLALTYGEALLQFGNYEGAYKQLYLLSTTYTREQVGILASYLLSILMATNDDPYSANFHLRNLQSKIRTDHPLASYHALSLAETSLATGHLENMKRSLDRDDIAYPDEIAYLRELRQADMYYAEDKSIKAYVAYQLALKNVEVEEHPYSLNGLCSTLYDQKLFQDSAVCYEKLGEMVPDRNQLAMIYFRENMARLHASEDSDQLINNFGRVEDTFPGTEGAFRAALKKNDLRYLTNKKWSKTAMRYYNALGEKSNYRRVSEESLFKEALLYNFTGDTQKCIELTMSVLRNFRSGPLRESAQALLIQILPDVLQRLVDEGKYMEALALARQNRQLFINNWIDINLLAGLGHSYQQLGIYDEALRIYLYLTEIANAGEREVYFLSLTEIAYEKGAYNLVEEYAAQYGFYYPNGQHHDTILFRRIKALYANDQIDKAISLLPETLPDMVEFKLLASLLYFNQNRYQEVVSILMNIWQQQALLPEKHTFILAESLFRIGRNDESEAFFAKVSTDEQFQDFSLYRLAEISKQKGNSGDALEKISQISENTNNNLWKRYADKELLYNQIISSL